MTDIYYVCCTIILCVLLTSIFPTCVLYCPLYFPISSFNSATPVCPLTVLLQSLCQPIRRIQSALFTVLYAVFNVNA